MSAGKSNQQLVREWQTMFGLPCKDVPGCPPSDRVELRRSLISEEFREVMEEFELGFDDGLSRLAKELGDLLWVIYGTGAEFGIDLDPVMQEIFASNMSKLDDNGKPIYREDGKVLKGNNYREADMNRVLYGS